MITRVVLGLVVVAAVCVTTAAVMNRRFLIGLWQSGGQAHGVVFWMGAISMMKIWYWMEMILECRDGTPPPH